MDLQLKGKTALISGSSKGIGLSIAQCLFNEGCNVVLNSRNSNSLKNIFFVLNKPQEIFRNSKHRIHKCC